MKTTFVIFLCFFSIQIAAFGQNFNPSYQSNPDLNFSEFLSGVKFAYIVCNDEFVHSVTDGNNSAGGLAISGVISYLNSIGFQNAMWGTIDNAPNNLVSYCDLAYINVSWNIENSSFTNIKLTFISCNNDIFEFTASKSIQVKTNTNIKIEFQNICMQMYGYKKNSKPNNRLNLPAEMTDWTEQSLKNYFHDVGSDPIEGIYENMMQTIDEPKYKIGVIKTNIGYSLIYLSGANNYQDWISGEVKGQLSATATPYLYKANWKMGNKVENTNAYVSFETGLMNLIMQGKENSVYLKLYPTSDGNRSINNNFTSSGTGFALSSNGLIVTNSHVVNGANKIMIRGINGDFTRTYEAKLLLEDKNNDLAIIQITDPEFVSLGTIPYTIASNTSDVGSAVYTLGYPLKAMMGDEIKLTNGIISSKSGFQGDVTSYQISVPLQPGNSGGPLFDSNGQLVGVVNAKLTIGENVSYAIKISYLKNLIELVSTPPKIQTINSLKGKPLTEQVKLLDNYIYIIEIN